ncbi:MAG: T9SS type A sorting domain-containing protein [Aequorivita sp.]|nr:T9SS type A sorting domain-containing protein [Aequorivita sp.]
MKNLLFYLVFLSSLACFAQFTAIPDANFENYLEQNGMGDGVPNNGQVLTANIENVTTLTVYAKQIQDLTGIEDFTAVELIGCAYNSIPFLDVSQNMNLQALNCESSDVVELLLPPTPTLEIVNCPENFLTELDISQNPGLEQLYCNINNIGSMDVTNNPLLELVSMEYNNISGFLDTSQNPILTSLSASHNNIIGFDLSQNQVLLSFGAADNPLQTLDVRNGNNENMVTFVAYGTSGNLDCILVDDAGATYLDDWFKDPGTTFVNNQEECDALGIATIDNQNFMMYPNPASGEVFLNVTNKGFNGLDVTVSNNLGQVLERKEKMENTAVIPLDVSSYTPGVYFVTLKAGDVITTKKLVVY